MQFSILIISEDNELEILLKQHFKDISINTNIPKQLKKSQQSVDESDLIIDQTHDQQVKITINNSQKMWKMVKPIAVSQMVSIVEQAIQILSRNMIQIGPITFYPNQRLCKFKDEEITLTVKEAEILLFLSQHPKQNIDKMTLLAEIWGYSQNISTHTLETHIYKLRNKFADKYDLIISSDSGYSLAF